MSKRNIGIAMIALGFVLTTMAGFFLAASNLDAGTLVTQALIVFAIVLPIMIFGIYLYVTSDEATSNLSETELQLKMIDIIREQGRVSLAELATDLNINIGTITQLVEDLDALDLFTGYIDWGNSVIYAVRPNELQDENP
ncbi:MAG: winged helix-turn-helix domain-containing protein [Anaerolineae bacterium]|nr:winged helix-turn-helix domain-containing protein [Anaerolineae bacterium]MDQ7034393.1 winged helix-turn-helix domain-containing protein [Anaerolineae bacterium]